MRRLIEEFATSERRVCGLMEIPRMTYRYQSQRNDTDLRERLLALARDINFAYDGGRTMGARQCHTAGVMDCKPESVLQSPAKDGKLEILAQD